MAGGGGYRGRDWGKGKWDSHWEMEQRAGLPSSQKQPSKRDARRKKARETERHQQLLM